jgi:hypothetical protein
MRTGQADTPWYWSKRFIAIPALIATAVLIFVAYKTPSDQVVTVRAQITQASGVHVFGIDDTVVTTNEKGEAWIPITGVVTDPNITSLSLEVRGDTPDTAKATITLVGGGFQGVYELGKSGSLLTQPRTYHIEITGIRNGGSFPVATGQVSTTSSPDPEKNVPDMLIIALGLFITIFDIFCIFHP